MRLGEEFLALTRGGLEGDQATGIALTAQLKSVFTSISPHVEDKVDGDGLHQELRPTGEGPHVWVRHQVKPEAAEPPLQPGSHGITLATRAVGRITPRLATGPDRDISAFSSRP